MTTFFRLLKDTDKATALRNAIATRRAGEVDAERTFTLHPDKFRKVPNTPFAYWVDDSIRDLFVKLPPFESEGRTVKQGLATADDFRFVRAWWEVDADRRLDPIEGGAPDWREDLEGFQKWCRRRTHQGKYWVPFAKGGEYSPYYSDIHLVVNWKNEGEEMKAFSGSVIRNPDYYFRPGVTWPRRSNKGMTVRAMNAGCVFADKGPVGYGPDLAWLLAAMNSRTFLDLVDLHMAFGSYEVGVIARTPLPEGNHSEASRLALRLCDAIRSIAVRDETNRQFGMQGGTGSAGVAQAQRFEDLQELHRLARDSYLQAIPNKNGERVSISSLDDSTATHTNSELWAAPATNGNFAVLSLLVGIAFGRFDVRPVADPDLQPAGDSPFSPLSVVPPAALVSRDGLPPSAADAVVDDYWLRTRALVDCGATASAAPEMTASQESGQYPIPVAWDGLLVNSAGHGDDIVDRLFSVADWVRGRAGSIPEYGALEDLNSDTIREYFGAPTGFFEEHLSQYSRSRRKAPIYWPLSTASGCYTIWLYYPRLDETTLFTAYQLAREKYDLLEKELVELQAIPSGDRTKQQQKRFDEVVRDVAEVHEFAEEILRITKLPYKPDHDDGVPICAAPLYKLFRHNAWSKYLQGIWEDLENGKYDWAHLAYAIWPDRVREKAREDKSIAIAHGLEGET